MKTRRPLCGFAPLRWAVLGVALTGTANAQADSTPLVTWEDILPARRGAALWVKNPSTDTVWIDSVHVEDCLNIRRGGCGSRAVEVALPPGAEKLIHRLEPATPRDPFSYRWFLDWRTAPVDSLPPRRMRRRPEKAPVRT